MAGGDPEELGGWLLPDWLGGELLGVDGLLGGLGTLGMLGELLGGLGGLGRLGLDEGRLGVGRLGVLGG